MTTIRDQVIAEIARLNKVLALLDSDNGTPKTTKARTPAGVQASTRAPMSEAARARMSKAAKARWREAKKAGKNRLG